MAGLAHRPGDVRGVHRYREPHDVDARRHDLADGCVPQVGEGGEDVLLLQVGDAPRLRRLAASFAPRPHSAGVGGPLLLRW